MKILPLARKKKKTLEERKKGYAQAQKIAWRYISNKKNRKKKKYIETTKKRNKQRGGVLCS